MFTASADPQVHEDKKMIRILKNHKHDFNSELIRFMETGAEVSYDNLAEFFVMPEEKLLAIWREKRGEVLADWKRKRRPGKPYIVNYIEEKKEFWPC